MMKQMEIFNLSRSGYVDSRTRAWMGGATYRDVMGIQISNGKVTCYHALDLFLKLHNIEIRFSLGEADHKAVLYVIVSAPRKLFGGHAELTEILRCVRHEPMGKGIVHDIAYFRRLGTEYGWAADQDLLTGSNQKIGVEAQQREYQIKMLNDYTFSIF